MGVVYCLLVGGTNFTEDKLLRKNLEILRSV